MSSVPVTSVRCPWVPSVLLYVPGESWCELDRGQVASSGPRKEKRVSAKPGRVQSRNSYLGKRDKTFMQCPERIPEKSRNSSSSSRSGRRVEQVETAECAPHTIWRQLDVHKMANSNVQSKNVRHAICKLNLHASTADSGASAKHVPVPSPLQCLHKGTGGSGLQWLRPGAYTCRRLAYLQHIDFHTTVTSVQKHLEKVSQGCQEKWESGISSSKVQAL